MIDMCTLALYFRVFPGCPLLVAANRDERYDRPSLPPYLWDSKPAIVAGKDLSAGGTWLGVNERGLLVGILNRRPTTAAKPDHRSRGLLCLDLLRLQSARGACSFMQRHRELYPPFTAVFADSKEAWVAFNLEERIERTLLNPGLHVFSSTGLHDEQSEKKLRAYQTFAALTPDLKPTSQESQTWISALAQALGDHRLGDRANDPKDAICVHSDVSGTVSSCIVVHFAGQSRFDTFYCPGAPCRNSFGGSLPLFTP